MRRVALASVLGLLAVTCLPAAAHKASDAYLQLDGEADGATLRVDVALRDLDAALDLDADADGKLTWGEVKAAWPRIERYVGKGTAVEGCALTASGSALLERRSDGAYAAVRLRSDCALRSQPRIAYTLLQDVDPTHRGIARVRVGGGPVSVRVLDPDRPDRFADASAPEAMVASDAGDRAAPEAASLGFLREGVLHILSGYDHVLFLLCLLLPSVMRRTAQGWQPVRRLSEAVWPVVAIVTSFTVAHSITLTLAALQLVALPSSIIEPAIAVTIVLAALDNVRPIFGGHRAIITFLFGLIHGFGFAGVLAELELPTARFAWALFQFNAGIEAGQIVIVTLAASVLFLARRRTHYATWVIRAGSVAAMVVGVAWFVERTANVSLLAL